MSGGLKHNKMGDTEMEKIFFLRDGKIKPN